MNVKKTLAAFSALAAASVLSLSAASVSAATKEDVIAAAYSAGFPETYVQQGMNYLETNTYTPEQYDQMVAALLSYTGRTDEAIKQYLGDAYVPSASEESSSSEEQSSGASQESSGNTESSGSDTASSEGSSPDAGAAAPAEKTFSEMTESEKDEYISNLSQAEKNQILKDLDRDKQLEIINSMIDASSALGMNVSLDSLTKEKIEYSIRNNEGDVVDISSIGVIVDDTGIDYTLLYLVSAGVVLASAAGIYLIARSFGKEKERI